MQVSKVSSCDILILSWKD